MVELRELKGAQKRRWQAIIEEELGYNFEEYADNQPYIYTRSELEQDFVDLAKAQGTPEQIADYYLDVAAMIRDEQMSGYLTEVEVDGQEYWARLY